MTLPLGALIVVPQSLLPGATPPTQSAGAADPRASLSANGGAQCADSPVAPDFSLLVAHALRMPPGLVRANAVRSAHAAPHSDGACIDDPAESEQTPAAETKGETDRPAPMIVAADVVVPAGLQDFRAFIERVLSTPAASSPAPANADASSAPASSGIPAADATVPHDPFAVIADLSALQPEFRVRIERVIQRMESEYGHDVTVAETRRSQPRQDQLFEQGRTAPGPVVTWTTRSRHTDGLAADLIIDGSSENYSAYERLHQIAAEEGLRTLGSRDPGHVELAHTLPDARTAKPAAAPGSEIRALAMENGGRVAPAARVVGG
ncbi:MAG TPA: M15 family metallopeptidase, partial [Gemmatimonadaceae bacterium]|nr:M15 family metallopeptidase [Gemmatimonadaceae bacterium]